MSGWAKPNVKCICVLGGIGNNDIGHGYWHPEGYPILKTIYTIRGLNIIGGEIGVLLNEIHSRLRPDGKEQSFVLERFRPLVSKSESEDLAVFRRIADLAGVDEALRRLEGVE